MTNLLTRNITSGIEVSLEDRNGEQLRIFKSIIDITIGEEGVCYFLHINQFDVKPP
jgi:hypothetical protein